ncbi:single-stranded DNA-binding protein [Nitratifractor sp.]
MYNRVILVGNLTRDVEIRYTPSGTAIGKVGIATNRRFKAANGEQKDETMFIDLTLFGRTAEIANQYLGKGRKVLVEGRLVLEQWTAADGTKRSKHSVTVENLQMLGSRDDAMGGGGNYGRDESYGSAPQAPQQPASRPEAAPQQPSVPEIDIDEEEIPF